MSQMTFVAFEPKEEKFIASVPVEQLGSLGNYPEALLRKASELYERHILVIRPLLDDIDAIKTNRLAIPAQKMWELGDAVFHLVDGLAELSFEIDGLYQHLLRDLEIHKGRLGMYRLTRAITFRRYLKDKELIPHSLDWCLCEKNARRTAEQLAASGRGPAVA